MRYARWLALVLLCTPFAGCSVSYVVKSAWHQAELLHSRVPVDELRVTGQLSPRQLAALDVVADVKKFGAELGLESTRNYDTVALRFRRRLFNVTASAPLAFEARTWWFPVVGRVP